MTCIICNFCLDTTILCLDTEVRIGSNGCDIADFAAKSFLHDISTWKWKHWLYKPRSTVIAFFVVIRLFDAWIRPFETAVTADIADFAAKYFLRKISIWNLKHWLYKPWTTLGADFIRMQRSDFWIRRSESAVTADICDFAAKSFLRQISTCNFKQGLCAPH